MCSSASQFTIPVASLIMMALFLFQLCFNETSVKKMEFVNKRKCFTTDALLYFFVCLKNYITMFQTLANQKLYNNVSDFS